MPFHFELKKNIWRIGKAKSPWVIGLCGGFKKKERGNIEEGVAETRNAILNAATVRARK